MVLYGDTHEELKAQMDRAADFFVDTIVQRFPYPAGVNIIRGYLDSHAIDHSVRVRFEPEEPVEYVREVEAVLEAAGV